MYIGKLFFNILLGVGLCFATFEVITDNDLNCKESAIQCLNDTSFTICTNIDNLTVILNKVLHCPSTYLCDGSTNYPCVLERPTKPTTPATTTLDASNTTSSSIKTTVKPVPRPTGPPDCKAIGFWPAPACNQYYECVSQPWLVFWTSFGAELRTCDSGLYYDTKLQQCIQADLSDCV